jgi:hypothetical protein
MALVMAWTVACILIAAIFGLLVLRIGMIGARAQTPAEDPLAYATRRAFHRDATPSGRIRLMFAQLAQREADAVGASLEPRALHRARV